MSRLVHNLSCLVFSPLFCRVFQEELCCFWCVFKRKAGANCSGCLFTALNRQI